MRKKATVIGAGNVGATAAMRLAEKELEKDLDVLNIQQNIELVKLEDKKHQSQKDGVVFQGTDSREFWQRAEDRNKETAELYDQLGLSHYAAMEAFVRWKY